LTLFPLYDIIVRTEQLWGWVRFPTGGKARKPKWHESAQFRCRQYSLDEKACFALMYISIRKQRLKSSGVFFCKILSDQPQSTEKIFDDAEAGRCGL